MAFLEKIFGDPNKKYLSKLQDVVEKINSFESEVSMLSDNELKEKAILLKQKAKNKEGLDNILAEAFALVRETSKRNLSQRHFDAQLIGGIVLHEGRIAEMKTGEGKTLSATLPAFLNALDGKGAHIITVNDYLAKRDAIWMGQIYYALGLSVGCITHNSAYLYDPSFIEEGTNVGAENKIVFANGKQGPEDAKDKERDLVGGFKVVESYLRPVSRKEAYQADILHGTNNEFAFDYLRDNLVYRLEDKVQRELNFAIVDEVDSILIDEARTPLIISGPAEDATSRYYEFTKIASELKEGEDYELDEKLKAASITEKGQNKVVQKLGTDPWAENDISTTHHIESALKAKTFFIKDRDYVVKNGEVIIVDEFTGRLMPGRRWSGGLHQAVEAKEGLQIKPESRTFANITFQNYFRLYKKLSGMTGTALTSAEELDKVYKLEVVPIPTHKPMIRQGLNDKIYKTLKEKYYALVEDIAERHKKGQPLLVGTVSIEKNEYLGKLLETKGISHQILNAKHDEREGEIIAQAGKLGMVTIATNMAGRGVDIVLGGNPPSEEEQKRIIELGGLHVIGTERHEARRIDNQLRGRAGRQGDPGSSQFFVSLEDDLMRIFGGDKIKNLMSFLKVPENQPIEANMVSKSIESAQSKIEGAYFDARKHILEYDDVVNKHREVFYKKRKEILEKYSNGVLKDYVFELIEKFEFSKDDYIKKEQDIGEQELREAEKTICLQIFDYFWAGHLEQMDFLKDQVRLRAYGQRDPLVEYKREGHKMFREFLDGIENMIADSLSRIEKKPEIKITRKQEMQKAASFSPADSRGSQAVQALSSSKKKIGRNDPCPCGSGKKYKKCCYPKYG